jgi:hypothetical protein
VVSKRPPPSFCFSRAVHSTAARRSSTVRPLRCCASTTTQTTRVRPWLASPSL